MEDKEKWAFQEQCWDDLQQFWDECDCIPTYRFAMVRGWEDGYRAALAAREAEVRQLEVERGVFAGWATREAYDAEGAMFILGLNEEQFRQLVNKSAAILLEINAEDALADHTP